MKRGVKLFFMFVVSIGLIYFSLISAGWLNTDHQDYIVDAITNIEITGEAVFDTASLNKDLVAHYSFSGRAWDRVSKSERPIEGAELINSGKEGQAYLFDGKNDYIGIGRPEDMTKSITWAGWAEVFDTDINRVLYERGGYLQGYQIYLNPANNSIGLRYRWAKGDLGYAHCKSGEDISDNSWHFIVAIMDVENKISRLYIDGVMKCEEVITPISKQEPLASHIGSHGSNAVLLEGYWKGGIDEINIWNRALSEDEVTKIYEIYSEKEEGEVPAANSQTPEDSTLTEETTITTTSSKEGLWARLSAWFKGLFN